MSSSGVCPVAFLTPRGVRGRSPGPARSEVIAIATRHPLDRLELTHRTRKRAEYEAFTFVPTATGVRVRNESHAEPAAHEYHVTVADGVPTACTCPADAHGDAACKHRVAVAIRPPVRQVATDPSAEPIPHDATAAAVDWTPPNATGSTAADGATMPDASADGPPADDCECAALDGAVPCWPCVRTGRKLLADASTGAREDGRDLDG